MTESPSSKPPRTSWVLAAVGMLGVLLLLLTPSTFKGQESGYWVEVRCNPVLLSGPANNHHMSQDDWESGTVNINNGQQSEVCSAKRGVRLGWALVLAIPTTVAASVAATQRHRQPARDGR